VEAVIGRKEERLSFLNEDGRRDFVHPLILVEFYVRGLGGFQIETLGDARFRFHALFDRGVAEPDKDAIRRKIAQRMGAVLAAKRMANVAFEVVEALELRRDPRSGKRRIVL
jgi:phenylacetate-CoA ligase